MRRGFEYLNTLSSQVRHAFPAYFDIILWITQIWKHSLHLDKLARKFPRWLNRCIWLSFHFWTEANFFSLMFCHSSCNMSSTIPRIQVTLAQVFGFTSSNYYSWHSSIQVIETQLARFIFYYYCVLVGNMNGDIASVSCEY